MDHISLLPNNIIYYIQSLLSLEEATRTCILSKAWKIICTLYPIIHLDYNNFIRSHYQDSKPDHDTSKKTFMTFVNNRMNSLVSQQQSFQVRQLYLKVIDKDYYNPFPHVNHWVEFLKQHCHVYVEEMCLVVQQPPCDGSEELSKRSQEECFIAIVAKGFQVLKIKNCYLANHDKNLAKLLSNFVSMKELVLRDVCLVDDLVLVKIMRSCPLIEVIELNRCCSEEIIKTIKVPEFPMIKTLSLIDHNPTSSVPTKFEIGIRNLESFKNWGRNTAVYWSTPEVCISIKKLYLKGLGGLSSNFFKDLETNFPLLEEAEIEDYIHGDYSDQNITHHRIRTLLITTGKYYLSNNFVMNCPRLRQFSYSGWGILEMSMDCSNLTQFKYSVNKLPRVDVFNSSLDIGRSELRVNGISDDLHTNWFVNLKRLVDLAGSNTTLFLEFESYYNRLKVKFVEDDEAVKIFPDRKVNLHVRISCTYIRGQSALLDGLLWSTHPTTFTIEGSRHYCYDFIKHLRDKLSDMKSKDKPSSYYNRKKWWHYIKDFEVESDLGIEDIKENLSRIAKLYKRTNYDATTSFKFRWVNFT